jgi:hypothetical protein
VPDDVGTDGLRGYTYTFSVPAAHYDTAA